jgi:methylated-DNA-[protein]-cysteine S-methyltransferase
MAALSVDTPLGPLSVIADDDAIVAIDWGRADEGAPTELLRRACAQIAEYFAGQRTEFDLPLAPRGREFQLRVWQALERIPYGRTLTYGAIAAKLGATARAVGGACGSNPIPILIPCHRVVGASGALTGYSGAGGTTTKQRLLDLETAQLALL